MASSVCEQLPEGLSDGVPGRRPRIGLTTYLEQATWGVWSRPAAIVPRLYVDAVVSAGGTPVLLPPIGTDPGVLDILDGLVLIGGADVDPATYGEEAHPRTLGTRPDRDAHEATLLARALVLDLPVLGVCRGAQLLNAALGGTLEQHLPDAVGHEGHRPAPAVFGRSEVSCEPGSLAAQVLGPRTRVPCYHHQALDRLAPGLNATAWAEDGTVEAVELEGGAWVLGVQWHPEQNQEDARLFIALVHAAGQFAAQPDSRKAT